MAYISPEQRQAKKEAFDTFIFEIFTTEGWDAITYERISKHFKTTNSSIQRYYPHRRDFGRALEGKVFPLVVVHLSFESKKAFIDSWVTAMDDQFFSMVVRMLIENALVPSTNEKTKGGAQRLIGAMMQGMTQQEAIEAIEIALGKSVFYHMNQGLT
ncbi:hypothetical protein [Vibrio coralliirubri]|uniref:hypothetical protein n=1 Tax=Vibrio coralliirubri TaxID=1516159 RepID=UPI0006399385|nr:hypothetical protein [Vibrio coralliirubri]CDT65530.1 conserved hypothetical protein [Vibrio coralliirubri]